MASVLEETVEKENYDDDENDDDDDENDGIFFPAPPLAIGQLLKSIEDWNFEIFKLAELSSDHVLSVVMRREARDTFIWNFFFPLSVGQSRFRQERTDGDVSTSLAKIRRLLPSHRIGLSRRQFMYVVVLSCKRRAFI